MLTGVAVLNGTSRLQNNSYIVANAEGLLDMDLFCVGSDPYWSYPNGLSISSVGDDKFNIATEFSTSRLMQQLSIIGSGSGEGSSDTMNIAVFNNPDDEGYYKCTAADEHGNITVISIGLFIANRGMPVLIPLIYLKYKVLLTCT